MTAKRGVPRRLVALLLCLSFCSTALAGTVSLLLENAAPEIYRSPGDGKQTATAIKPLEQAVQLFEQQDFDQCYQLLEKAAAENSFLPPARLMMARFFLSHDQVSPGRMLLEKVAVETPEYPGVYLTFARLALREGRATDAAVHLEKASALAEEGTWTEPQRNGFLRQRLDGLASVAEIRQDWTAAREHLEKFLELDPHDAQANCRMARVLLALGMETQAHDHFRRAAADDPTLDPSAVAMGWWYARHGDDQKASHWMNEAVTKAPEDPRAHVGIGAWLLQQGRLDQAKMHADTAAQLDPESGDAQLLVAMVARYRKDYDAAEKWLRKLHERSPQDFQISNQLVLVLAEQADPRKRHRALELAQTNLKDYPSSQAALATAGRVYFQLQRYDDAQRVLALARARGRLAPDAAYFLASVLAKQQRTAEAAKLLKQLLAQQQHFVFRGQAEDLLSQVAGGASTAE